MKSAKTASRIFFTGVAVMLITGARTAFAQLVLQGTNTVDLGVISRFDKRSVEYRFRNPGEKPVKVVKLAATCSCISADKNCETVGSGEELLVTVRLDPRTVHGSFKRVVWMITDDCSADNKVALAVTGEVRPLFTGLPASPVAIHPVGSEHAVTNDFELTCIYTNFVPAESGKYTSSLMDIDATLTRTGITNYHLRTVVVLKTDNRGIGILRLPVAAPIDVSPLRLSFRTVGRRGASPAVSGSTDTPSRKRRRPSFKGRGGRTFFLPPPRGADPHESDEKQRE
ncbi:MAG: DUF1573 domain-containing protein [Kiritimatiellia bacterium]